MAVLQNGTVTPGHIAIFTTDGVIQDGGPATAAQRVLGVLLGTSFNSTADQAILINPAVQAFTITGIIVTNASISLTSAVGGFYPGAAKTGSPIVAAGQAYSALTTATALMNATLTAFTQTTRFSSANLVSLPNVGGLNSLAIYFSLTSAQGSLATADVYVVGLDLTA